jgi:hypothetical protein
LLEHWPHPGERSQLFAGRVLEIEVLPPAVQDDVHAAFVRPAWLLPTANDPDVPSVESPEELLDVALSCRSGCGIDNGHVQRGGDNGGNPMMTHVEGGDNAAAVAP